MNLLENLFSQGAIERLGWMLVHFLWQATAVAVLLAVVLRLLRRASANLRYAVACGALALMVVLPLVTMQLVEVAGPVAEAGPPPATTPPPVIELLPATIRTIDELPPLEALPTFEIADVSVPIPWQERVKTALESALPYVVFGWLVGVFGLSAWHLGGWTQLQRLKRRMVCEADTALREMLAELATKLGVRRAVALLESAIVEVPTVVGWLRPVILLPASALTGLSPDQLRAILAHELAHIRRYDYLANILQTVVEILGFYHPALWWVSHRIRIERENCCDDLAVRVCGDSLQYARALTSMEEIRHSRSDLAMAATGGSLMARIARLLGRPVVDDRRFAWLPGLIALLLVAGIVMPVALTLHAADLSEVQAATPDDTPDWVKAVLTALPGWETEHADATPSVTVGERKGLRLIMRRGQKAYLEPRQREEDLRKAKFVLRYQHMEIVVFPGDELLAGDSARIGWTEWEDELPYFKKAVHIGRGMDMTWYARATIYDQERLRQALKLEDGDDRLALLTEGMLVRDQGTMTHNSCMYLLAAAGDKAIPYIQSAVEGHEDGVQAIHALALIKTDAATEYLQRLYQAERTTSAAEYALIHEPFRRGAKEQYLDMLQRRRYVIETANACVQFGWKEAMPLLHAVYEQTHLMGEFGVAFHAARTLEGRPVPAQVDQAQGELQQWVYSEQPPTKEELAEAKAMLLSSPDTEAAIVAAIQVAMASYKASHDRLELIREVGREILRELPHEETMRIINRLVESASQASDEWWAERLREILPSDTDKPSTSTGIVPMVQLAPIAQEPVVPAPSAAPHSAPEQAEDAGWSASLNGLRVRLRAPRGTAYRRNALLPLVVEVQNSSDKPVAYSSLWPTVRFLAYDGKGKSLGIPWTGPEMGDWACRPGGLAPGQVTRLDVHFQALRFLRPLEAGETVRIQAGAPTQQERPGQLPLEVGSAPLVIELHDAFPPSFTDADVPDVWQMDLACHLDVGLQGSQTLHVSADGTARLLQRYQREGKLVNGRLSAVLPPDRLNELAAALRKMEVWKLGRVKWEIPYPDEGSIRLTLVSRSGGSLAGEFAHHMEQDQPIVQELRRLLEDAIADIEKRATTQRMGIERTPTGRAVQVMTETLPSDDTETQEKAQVLVDFTIAKALTTAVLDRETMLLIGETFAAEKPQAATEIARADPTQDVTLGEVLHRYVAGQLLSPETGQALLDLLGRRGFVEVLATPRILTADGREAEMRIGSQEVIPPSLQDDGTTAEAAPKKIECGIRIKTTPHVTDANTVLLEMLVAFTEPMPQAQPDDAPVIRTREIASTVVLPDNQYGSLVMESGSDQDSPHRAPESLLVMFRATINQPAPMPGSTSSGPANSAATYPQQVLLEVRTVAMDRRDLEILGKGHASLSTGGQIIYSPDRKFTETLLAALDRLEAQSQIEVLSNQYVIAMEGRESRVKAVTQEWFSRTARTDPPSPPKDETIDSGTTVTVTPRIGADETITLRLAVETSESIPRGPASDLPIVTRRQSKNEVTLQNGGTVAVAGLTEGFGRQDGQPTKDIVIFVTARLAPEIKSQQSPTPTPLLPEGSGVEDNSARTDLLDALAQISRRFGVKVAVDLTVKPRPVTIDLAAASVTAALQQVLQGTPYTVRSVADGESPTCLVYSPISAEFMGVEIRVVLADLAAMAGVPIIPDPSVQGKTYAAVEKAPLERALQTVLTGTPYTFKRMSDYYLVAETRSASTDGFRPVGEPSLPSIRKSGSDFTIRRSGEDPSAREFVAARHRYVGSDPIVRGLSESIAEMERDLIVLLQTCKHDHPAIVQRRSLLKAFQDQLQQRRSELEREFDEALEGPAQGGESEQDPAVQSPPPQESETMGNPPDTPTHIALRVSLVKVLMNRGLDRDTARQVFDLLTPVDAASPPVMSLNQLRGSTVGQILSSLAERIPAGQFRAVVQVLSSKGLLDRVAEPTWCVQVGRPTEISGGNLALKVHPEILRKGRTIQLDAQISMDITKPVPPPPGGVADQSLPLRSTHSIKTSVSLEVPNGRHGVLSLGGVMSGSDPTDALTYCLLFQPTIVTAAMEGAATAANDTGDSPVVSEAIQAPGAWAILRQPNSPPLLLGLAPRLARLLEPEHRNDPVWAPWLDDGQLVVTIDMDEPNHAEVTIGLFEDAKWSKDPVAVRRVAGAGMHVLTGLPAGRFQVGAIAGKYAHALGVQRQWPQPVEIRTDRAVGAELLVSKDFKQAASLSPQGVLWNYLGHWDDPDEGILLRGRVTGPNGEPIPFATVQVREYQKSPAGGIAAPNLGTDMDGVYKFAGMRWPYTVGVLWHDSMPTIFGSRYQYQKLNRVFEGPQAVDFRFDPFPQGTAGVSGRVVDQNGDPVQGFYLDVRTMDSITAVRDNRRQNPDGRTYTEYGYKMPFVSEDGTFAVTGLPEGPAMVTARAFDDQHYEVGPGKEIVLETGKTADLQIQLARTKLFYGRVLFEDGSPAVAKPAPWEGAKTVIRMHMTIAPGSHGYYNIGEIDDHGYFAFYLKERELKTLRSGQSELDIRVPTTEQGSYQTVAQFPLERLSEDRRQAGVVTVERP